MSAAVVAGCETSSTVTTNPGPVKCQVSLASLPMMDATGGSGSLAITTQPECVWDASTTAGWISALTPASGQGAAAVAFRVAPNEGSSSREGMIVVNGEQARLSQRAACRYEVGPANQDVEAGGGGGTVTVATLSECTWTAATDVAWISLSSASTASGNGSVSFTVAPNTGERRMGSVIVAGQRSNVTQASPEIPPPSPCASTISPTSQSVAAAGGVGMVSVSSAATCAWTASSSVSWVTITAGASGTGNGSVAFSVAANTGAARTGTLTIASRAFTVTQAAAGGTPPTPPPACTYAISPTSRNFSALGGLHDVRVTTASGCAWTASSDAAWVLITSGASGTGNGTVDYSVVPNLGGARSATLTIGGQAFTVTQAAVAPCSYSIAPGNQRVEGTASTASVTVTTASGCAWTAVSNTSWITVTSGATGTGNGSVTFDIAANPGNDREGTLTVAGRTATVEQRERRK